MSTSSPGDTAPRPWGRRTRRVAAAGWASFLVACAASVPFFGLFDPAELAAIASVRLPAGTMTAYAVFFFAIWLTTAAAAVLTLALTGTGARS